MRVRRLLIASPHPEVLDREVVGAYSANRVGAELVQRDAPEVVTIRAVEGGEVARVRAALRPGREVVPGGVDVPYGMADRDDGDRSRERERESEAGDHAAVEPAGESLAQPDAPV